jgi:predicted dehydrogenase
VDFVLLESVDGRRHLAEAIPVFKSGKRMFIDKPLSNTLVGAIAILEAAKKYNSPVFSCSSTRFSPVTLEIVRGKEKVGKVIGVDAYGSSYNVTGHIDMSYYGIHAIECLYTLMGTGCKKVVRVDTPTTDIIVGTWEDGRAGVYRTAPRGSGARVIGDQGIEDIRTGAGYDPMLVEIMKYFRTGIVPVKPEETIELFAFMQAADDSKLYGGAPVNLDALIQKATREAKELI